METMHGKGDLQCNNLDFVFLKALFGFVYSLKKIEGGVPCHTGPKIGTIPPGSDLVIAFLDRGTRERSQWICFFEHPSKFT